MSKVKYPERLRSLINGLHRDAVEIHLTDDCSLEHDLLELIKSSSIQDNILEIIEGVTDLRPKIDDDGYFGADFELVDLDGREYPVEMFVHSIGLVMFFKEQSVKSGSELQPSG